MGCATRQPVTIANECVKPELRGETWIDVAILSIEQAAAIDVCNIRNGVDTTAKASESSYEALPVPTKARCLTLGVNVRASDRATGRILSVDRVSEAGLYKACGIDGTYIGCTKSVGTKTYRIYFTDPSMWVQEHEACHAYYNRADHTLNYLTSRTHVK